MVAVDVIITTTVTIIATKTISRVDMESEDAAEIASSRMKPLQQN